MELVKKTIVIIANNSIHSKNLLQNLSKYYNNIIFITNNHINLSDLSDNNIQISTYIVDFRILNIITKYKIAKIIKNVYHTNFIKQHQHTILDNDTQNNNTLIIHILQANSYAYHAIKAINLLNRTQYSLKIILSIWGSDVLLLPKKNKFFYNLVKNNLIKSDAVITQSLFINYAISNIIFPKTPEINNKLHYLHYGINNIAHNTYYPILAKQNIIFSNRLHKKLYNIDKIILAFNNLIKQESYTDYKLVIAASGNETQSLMHLVDNLSLTKQVSFVGMLDHAELLEYYKISKIFISIPSSDAVAVSLLEAMSYSNFPIVSNLPANLELIIDNFNGYICNSLNPTILSALMQRAIEIVDDEVLYSKIAKTNFDIIYNKYNATTNFVRLINDVYNK